MNKLSGMPIVLVQMIGAKSGKPRTIPLMYVPNEKGFVLVASQGGTPKHPLWYHNLIKHPDIVITHDGKAKKCVARRVSDEEKVQLWPTCVEYYPPYQDYQERTTRNIPVFLCEERDSELCINHTFLSWLKRVTIVTRFFLQI